MRRIVISSAKSLFPTLCLATFYTQYWYWKLFKLICSYPTLIMLSSKPARTHFVVHTSTNDCRTDQLLQTFKVPRFDLKWVETTILYRRWSFYQCPAFCAERTVSDSCPTYTVFSFYHFSSSICIWQAWCICSPCTALHCRRSSSYLRGRALSSSVLVIRVLPWIPKPSLRCYGTSSIFNCHLQHNDQRPSSQAWPFEVKVWKPINYPVHGV